MGMSDERLDNILKKMGVDTSEPPHWIPHIHRVISQTTGHVVREYNDGYTCSYCGKHSYMQKENCDGCNSIMKRSNTNG